MTLTPPVDARWPARRWLGRGLQTGRVAVVAGAGGALAGAALAAGAARLGIIVPLAITALAAAVVLVWRPALAMGVLGAAVVLAEADSQAMFNARRFLYRSMGGLPVTPLLVLVALAVIAASLHLDRRDRPLLAVPNVYVFPLGALVLALPIGAVSGYFGGANLIDLANELTSLLVLLLLPFAVAGVVRGRWSTRTAAVGAAVLAAVKIAEGLISWVLGAGRPLDDTTITFYEPTALWLLLLFVVGGIALLLRRAMPLHPLVLTVVVALAYLTIALSLRRGFWVGTAVATVLAVLVATGRRGRALIIPAALVLAVSVVVVLRAGGATDSRNVAIERAQSVTPSRLAADDEDRYRLEEQKNVRREIVKRPLTGKGMAVGWTATSPLPLEHEGGRLYVHFVVLWYWLKLGVFGALAYVALIVMTVRAGVAVWLRHPDSVVRAGGLAVGLGAIGLAIVEMTASFTGVSARFTVLFALAMGWLSVAWSEAQPAARAGR